MQNSKLKKQCRVTAVFLKISENGLPSPPSALFPLCFVSRIGGLLQVLVLLHRFGAEGVHPDEEIAAIASLQLLAHARNPMLAHPVPNSSAIIISEAQAITRA